MPARRAPKSAATRQTERHDPAGAGSEYRHEQQRDVLNRLKRIEGQIRAVIDMIEGGSSCEDIAQQMAASRKAMDRAFFRMMACTVMESVVGGDPAAAREVERSTRILEKYA
jgi:CsoR family transcriptional regulator, copper-sensing transcriptional repressor